MNAKEMFNCHQFFSTNKQYVKIKLIQNETNRWNYHGNKSTILLFYSIFRTTPEVSSKLYFDEICQVSEKLWLFKHKRADFWLPKFGFKRSLLSLLEEQTLFTTYSILFKFI